MIYRRVIAATLALATISVARVSPLVGQAVPGTEPLGGQEPLLAVRVDSLVVRGHDRYSESSIQRIAQLRVGEVVNGPDLQDAIRRLFSTGGFDDVRISVTQRAPAIFYIDVVERPLIGRYRFQGLKHLNEKTVVDTIRLVQGEALDPGKVAEARTMIRRLLAREGFPQAEVDTALAPDPTGLDQLDLTFRVREGPRLALARVDFTGNASFTDAQVRGSMKTVEEGFFWFKPGELQRDEYRLDLTERIPDFYGRNGYIDLEVLGDTIVVDTLTGKGRIEIAVREGPRYLLRSFEIEGNRRFPTVQLAEYFETARGGRLSQQKVEEQGLPPFDQFSFREATRKVADLYRDAGYLGVRVIPDVIRNPPDSVRDEPTVDARWLISEGQPAYIRSVDIVGNDYTHDRVIRKVLLTLPGDVYSQQLLIQSVRNIQSLGFFETLPPDEAIQIRPRDDGDIDIVYRVKERQTGNINFGLSAAAAIGIAGFIGYDQPNLFGQAKNGHFRWLFGRRSQDIELTYSDPEVLGTRNSATIGLQSSRDRFRTFDLGTRRRTGGFFEVGLPILNLRSTRFYAGYSLFREKIDDLEGLGLSPSQQQLISVGTRSTLSLRLVRDTRSGGIFPTAGSRNSASLRKTGGFLGGDGDYNRWDFTSEWFANVGRIGGRGGGVPIELVAGLSLEAGLLFGDNPFFQERYFVGGTQVGNQVRGYQEATITPRGHVPRNAPISSADRVGDSFFTGSAQFGIKLTDNIFASTFVDAGNVWASSSQFNPTDLLVGAGLGVSLITPFGPIGIDYAYGFDRRDVLGRPDPGWQLHFRFGRVF